MNVPIQKFIVSESFVGRRLDQYEIVSSESEKLSRAQLHKLIRAGHLTLDGKVSIPSYTLRGGEHLVVKIPEARPTLPPATLPLDILFEDDALLVINKQAHLCVHPGAGTRHETTLVHGLLARGQALSQIGAPLRPGLVHRLDKDTTGVMVIAKSDLAFRRLVSQFAEREVEKKYFALVWGAPRPNAGLIESTLARHPTMRHQFASALGHGKLAQTRYRLVATHGAVSLIEVALLTGRTHQIRVHMAELGHAIVADKTYGTRAQRGLSMGRISFAPELTHQALHARTLQITHPLTHEKILFRAPFPNSWGALAHAMADSVNATLD